MSASDPHRKANNLPRTLSDFEGRWEMTRQIDDRLAGTELHLEGQAELTSEAGGMLYVETGTLVLADGQRVTASRRYLWRQQGERIAVSFEDGRPFHGFSLATSEPEATHWCDPDDYRVRYEFSNWPEWSAIWQVCGPRKDYLMTTRYRRA